MDLLTLVRQDTGAEFRQAASTHGGEYHGPCPLCGGEDRFCVWPSYDGGKARWWCRRCMGEGERKRDLADYLELVHGMSHVEALKAAGVVADGPPGRAQVRYNAGKARQSEPAPEVQPPGEKWQERARALVQYAQGQLWADVGRPALEYLRAERGLTEETIRKWGLGYNAAAHYDDAGRWGADGQKVYISPGIVIPWQIAGAIWFVQIRRPHMRNGNSLDTLCVYLWCEAPKWRPEAKYLAVKGGQGKALFGADDLRGDRPLVLCEGEFDAILAWQEIGDLVDVATLGGASKGGGGIPGRWLLRLLPYNRILVAYDVDPAGDSGAADLLKQSKRAVSVKVPQGDDLTAFWRSGGDLRAWIAFQLAALEV